MIGSLTVTEWRRLPGPRWSHMENRIAFVTGASRGIGHSIALSLGQAGYTVVAAARSMEGSAALESLRAVGAVSAVNLDLASPDSIKEAIGRTIKEHGRIDVLVNNAGVTRDGLAVRMKAADWDAVLRTNLDGSFLCIQQVLSGMMRKRWGRIVNITSVVGQAGSPGQANYAASKAGLIGMTKSLAQEVASRNITVNAVAPGYIATDMTKDLSEELKKAIMARIPLARMGTPEDIAAAVKFLAGDEASYITGQVIAVNGGMYM
jgi:3-oxoacyl-[acyl-carrier protein] reductase